MRHCRIRARLVSPLVIRENRMSSESHGLNYLPGSSFRGAVAAKFLRETGTPEDETFRLLFIEKPVCFPNLFPTDGAGHSPSRVLPLTSVSCKRHPGFKGSGAHGVSDALAEKLVERSFPELERGPCPVCKNVMKPYAGFWNGHPENPKGFKPAMFHQRHTGIDRETGTVAPSIFYTTQAIADFQRIPDTDRYHPQFLSGEMAVTDEQFEALEPLLEGSLFAGAECTRGRGELDIDIHDFQPSEPDIMKWSEDFKAKLEKLIPENAPPEEREKLLNRQYFSIKLESDAILVDKFLRPKSDIDITFDGIDYVMKVARPQTVRGWNAAWGLPKPDDQAVAMGSVYLFNYQGTDTDALGNHLRELAVNGIGLRREEGFGKILVCDPLHVMTEEVI